MKGQKDAMVILRGIDVVNDQPRGTGVHLGGTIAETFGWYEIVTVP